MDRLPPFADRKPTLRSRFTTAGIVAALHLLFVVTLMTTNLAPQAGVAKRFEEAWITTSIHTDQPIAKSSQKSIAATASTSEPSNIQAREASPVPSQSSVDLEQPAPSPGPTTNTSAPSESAAVSPDVASEFQDQLVAHIQPFQRYPQNAGAGRPQGTTVVVFSMNRSGAILGVWVVKSSGYPALDDEAVATIKRAQPLPSIPPELPDTLNVTVPVRFDPPA